jgi:periplasmic divalent cation tolerance protein
MTADMIYIFWSCRDKVEAKKIIHQLLDQWLIACASIFPGVESIYRWEGEIEESFEVKVILKTDSKHFEAIQNAIKTQCSYEVPEIVQVDITRGNAQYLSWIAAECDLSHSES